MDRGAWQATVNRVAESDTTKGTARMHTCTHMRVYLVKPVHSLGAECVMMVEIEVQTLRAQGGHCQPKSPDLSVT